MGLFWSSSGVLLEVFRRAEENQKDRRMEWWSGLEMGYTIESRKSSGEQKESGMNSE